MVSVKSRPETTRVTFQRAAVLKWKNHAVEAVDRKLQCSNITRKKTVRHKSLALVIPNWSNQLSTHFTHRTTLHCFASFNKYMRHRWIVYLTIIIKLSLKNDGDKNLNKVKHIKLMLQYSRQSVNSKLSCNDWVKAKQQNRYGEF